MSRSDNRNRSQSRARSLLSRVTGMASGAVSPPPAISTSSGDGSGDNSEDRDSSSSTMSHSFSETTTCKVCLQTLGDEGVITCHGCRDWIHKACRTMFRVAGTHDMSMCTICRNQMVRQMDEVRQECRDNNPEWAEKAWLRKLSAAHKDKIEAFHHWNSNFG